MSIEYKVVEKDTTKRLINSVNAMITNGWKPIGGVSISISEADNYRYFIAAQAMIRGE